LCSWAWRAAWTSASSICCSLASSVPRNWLSFSMNCLRAASLGTSVDMVSSFVNSHGHAWRDVEAHGQLGDDAFRLEAGHQLALAGFKPVSSTHSPGVPPRTILPYAVTGDRGKRSGPLVAGVAEGAVAPYNPGHGRGRDLGKDPQAVAPTSHTAAVPS